MKAFFIFISVLAIGCSTRIYSTPEEAHQNTQVSVDEFTKAKTVVLRWDVQANKTRYAPHKFSLFQMTKDGSSTLGIAANFFFFNWRFIEECYDKQEGKLPTTQQDRIVENGSEVRELVSMQVTRAFLDRVALSGTEIKCLGQRGSEVFQIPSAHVVGFLRKLDSAPAKEGTP